MCNEHRDPPINLQVSFADPYISHLPTSFKVKILHTSHVLNVKSLIFWFTHLGTLP